MGKLNRATIDNLQQSTIEAKRMNPSVSMSDFISSPLPPAHLRFKVHGSEDAASYANVGETCARNIHDIVASVGQNATDVMSLFDFGCGCGRIAPWLHRYMPQAKYTASDIDHEAVLWCQTHLPFLSAYENGPIPPLTFSDGSFDLIVAISLFTHLDEAMQFAWLRELQRVLQTGQLLVMSVHGDSLWPKEIDDVTREKGFLFKKATVWRDKFPEWYQSAFHTEKYINTNYSEHFSVLKYVPKGLNTHQDLLVLQKR
jgi:ubiquinone/menaquinone biosynthesis C-methylase UbiE